MLHCHLRCQLANSASEIDLSPSAEDVDAIVSVAACPGDGGAVMIEAGIVQEETHLIVRDPDERGVITMLAAAVDAVAGEIEMIVAQVQLESARAALAERSAYLGALPA